MKKMSKWPMLFRLDEIERAKIEQIAESWGVNLNTAMRRIIREYDPEAIAAMHAWNKVSTPIAKPRGK